MSKVRTRIGVLLIAFAMVLLSNPTISFAKAKYQTEEEIKASLHDGAKLGDGGVTIYPSLSGFGNNGVAKVKVIAPDGTVYGKYATEEGNSLTTGGTGADGLTFFVPISGVTLDDDANSEATMAKLKGWKVSFNGNDPVDLADLVKPEAESKETNKAVSVTAKNISATKEETGAIMYQFEFTAKASGLSLCTYFNITDADGNDIAVDLTPSLSKASDKDYVYTLSLPMESDDIKDGKRTLRLKGYTSGESLVFDKSVDCIVTEKPKDIDLNKEETPIPSVDFTKPDAEVKVGKVKNNKVIVTISTKMDNCELSVGDQIKKGKTAKFTLTQNGYYTASVTNTVSGVSNGKTFEIKGIKEETNKAVSVSKVYGIRFKRSGRKVTIYWDTKETPGEVYYKVKIKVGKKTRKTQTLYGEDNRTVVTCPNKKKQKITVRINTYDMYRQMKSSGWVKKTKKV